MFEVNTGIIMTHISMFSAGFPMFFNKVGLWSSRGERVIIEHQTNIKSCLHAITLPSIFK